MKKLLTAFISLIASVAYASPETVLHETTAKVRVGGSGAVIESPTTHRKYFLTNWHVCNLAPVHAVLISETETGEVIGGRVVYKDPSHDLCLIEVDQRRPAIQVGSSLKVGDTLYSHGYPEGRFISSVGILQKEDIAYLNVLGSLRKGKCPRGFDAKYNMLSVLVGCFYPYPEGITTLFSAGGSSGSPVVNADGELVGVIQSHDGNGNTAGIIMLPRIREFMIGY